MEQQLGDKEVAVGGQKLSAGTTIRFTVKTALWILGALYAALGYLYYDLRTEFKEANGISKEEKVEFLKEIEDEYEAKFDDMKDDISDIKGDVKVILDRTKRDNPIIVNPSATIQPTLPPEDSPTQ